MIEGDLDDSPEYFRAKEEFAAYWKRSHNGLESGVDDDPTVSIARLVKQFGSARKEYAKRRRHNRELAIPTWRDVGVSALTLY
jgi:hypothetical protein